jgi:hypothetical protein
MKMRILAACAAAVALLIGTAGGPVAAAAPGQTTEQARPAAVAAQGWGHIRSFWNQYCLDADNTTLPANGTKVQLWECNGSPQQGWAYVPLTNGTTAIVLEKTGQCLEKAPGSDYGIGVQVWDCNYLPQQQWTVFFDQTNNTFWYRNGLGGLFLDADNSHGTGNGTRVQVWGWLNGANQKWI